MWRLAKDKTPVTTVSYFLVPVFQAPVSTEESEKVQMTRPYVIDYSIRKELQP